MLNGQNLEWVLGLKYPIVENALYYVEKYTR